jgi:hypothetical protein
MLTFEVAHVAHWSLHSADGARAATRVACLLRRFGLHKYVIKRELLRGGTVSDLHEGGKHGCSKNAAQARVTRTSMRVMKKKQIAA